MSRLLGYYENGNYVTSITSDGKIYRSKKVVYEGAFLPDRVESVHLKITNKCGGNDSGVSYPWRALYHISVVS